MENAHEYETGKTSNKGNAKNYVLIGMVALILVMSIFQSFQINKMRNEFTGNAVKNVGAAKNTQGGVDMTGWTDDEKMQYEHHGVLPSRVQGNAPQQSGMVGGC